MGYRGIRQREIWQAVTKTLYTATVGNRPLLNVGSHIAHCRNPKLRKLHKRCAVLQPGLTSLEL